MGIILFQFRFKAQLARKSSKIVLLGCFTFLCSACEGKPNIFVSERCCNYISGSYCVNDSSFKKIEKSYVRDFVITSFFDNTDEINFVTYEGNHPNYNSREFTVQESNTIKNIEILTNNSDQIIVKLKDGATPSTVHFFNSKKDNPLSIDMNKDSRVIFFRTEKNYENATLCRANEF